MYYARRRRRDSGSPVAALLAAAGIAGLLGVLWRLRAAPRTRTRRARSELPRSATRLDDVTACDDDLQTRHGGTGPIFHRQYEVELPGVALGAATVVKILQRNFSQLAPSILARFEKTNGLDDHFRVGDEYEITMLGPWNGTVRVLELTPTSFTLATLDGHPEAGHITFSAASQLNGPTHARIESWARARDTVVQAAYDTLGVGKQVQTEAWVTFLHRLARLVGVQETPEVRITDEEIPGPSQSGADAGPAAND